MQDLIYLDNQSTTRTDPRVVAAMLPYFTEQYANPSSVTHEFGRQAADAIEDARAAISTLLNGAPDGFIFTSGATEATNLAVLGICTHQRQKRRKIVTLRSEHHAVLGPLQRLEQSGFLIHYVDLQTHAQARPGELFLDQAITAIDGETAMVCVMLTNNEIGVLQPLRKIADRCREVGAILFSDATAAVGKVNVDLQGLGVDMLCFSAHKFYGPKGVGGLWVNPDRRECLVRPQILGGGQQNNRRSGTLNLPAIIGMKAALQICAEDATMERPRLATLQRMLYEGIQKEIGDDVELNGPSLDHPDVTRVAENLNLQWRGVEGQSLMLETPALCYSLGSACSSLHQEPSHVLQAIGRTPEQARCATRISLGRFNSESEIEQAVEIMAAAYKKLVSTFR